MNVLISQSPSCVLRTIIVKSIRAKYDAYTTEPKPFRYRHVSIVASSRLCCDLLVATLWIVVMIPHVSVCREEHSAMLVSAILLADAPASTTAFDITQHVLNILHFWTTTIAPRIAKESVRISIGQTSFKIKKQKREMLSLQSQFSQRPCLLP